MPYEFVNGIRMYYETEGQGFPLVAITGLGSSLESWSPEYRSGLSRHFSLLAMDVRGAGRSDAPQMDYTMAMMAQDIAELLFKLGWDKAHVFGVSMGGMIAQELALNYPERVEKLVLGCTSCGKRSLAPPEEARQALSQSGNLTPEEIAALMYPPEFIQKHPEVIAAALKREAIYPMPPEVLARQYAAVMSFDSYDRLVQIQAPTLVITGDQDKMINPENSRLLADLIPQARLEVIPGSGHGFTEQEPEKVLALLHDFLV